MVDKEINYTEIINEINKASETTYKRNFDEAGLYIKDGVLIVVSQNILKWKITIPKRVKSASFNAIDGRNFSLKYKTRRALLHSTNKKYIFNGPKLTKDEEKYISDFVLINEKEFKRVENKNLLNIMTNYYKIEDGILTRINFGLEVINVPKRTSRIDISNAVFIRQITLPNTVKSLENNAFDNCYSLKEIYIPESVLELRNNVITNCVKLKEVNLSTNVQRLI